MWRTDRVPQAAARWDPRVHTDSPLQEPDVRQDGGPLVKVSALSDLRHEGPCREHILSAGPVSFPSRTKVPSGLPAPMIPSDRQNINKAWPRVAKGCEKACPFPLAISDCRRTPRKDRPLQTSLPTHLPVPSPAPTRGEKGSITSFFPIPLPIKNFSIFWKRSISLGGSILLPFTSFSEFVEWDFFSPC